MTEDIDLYRNNLLIVRRMIFQKVISIHLNFNNSFVIHSILPIARIWQGLSSSLFISFLFNNNESIEKKTMSY
jgi:hypothetical protein